MSGTCCAMSGADIVADDASFTLQWTGISRSEIRCSCRCRYQSRPSFDPSCKIQCELDCVFWSSLQGFSVPAVGWPVLTEGVLSGVPGMEQR
eukprot:1631143-Rhodomonas_salina.2